MDGAVETPQRRRLRWTLCSALLTAAMWVGPLAAAECRIDFDAHTPQRVELYTSEGCSSCPPADRWLAALPARGDRMLLALHVDYWNELGWPDRFADARFSERQRATAARWPRPRVYTPAVVVDGREASAWRNSLAHPDRTAAAPLSATLRESDDGVAIRLAVPQGLSLHAAVTEDGLFTRVGAGENRGRTLRHDHVVRAFAGPARGQAELRLTWPADLAHRQARLLVWLEDASGRTVHGLQRPLGVCKAHDASP